MTAPPNRRLNLFDATMLVMGGVIGVGIFFTPQNVARLVPSTGAYFLLWTLGGVAALAGSMTFAELAGTFPRSGGWFVFLREAFGRFPAFLFAWVVLFVISTGASAVIADFSASQFLELARLAGAGPPPPWLHTSLGLAIIAGVTGVALRGAKAGALLQNTVMLLKLGALGCFVIAGWLVTREVLPDPVPSVQALAGAGESTGLGEGMIRAALPVLFSYGGWQLVTYIAHEVEDPQRTLPRAILIGSVSVLLVYLAVNLAFVRVLGLEGLATTDSFAAEMVRRSMGARGGTLVVGAMALSSLGICAAILLATPGLYVAMAREGLFLETFGRLNRRTGAPVAALLVQGVVVTLYFAWGHADRLTDAVVFAEWIFHALTGAALIAIRRRRPELPRPFRSPWYPLFPALYSSLAVIVVIGQIVSSDWKRTGLGTGVLAFGALVYRPWRGFLERRT